jgi:hypothetical protein
LPLEKPLQAEGSTADWARLVSFLEENLNWIRTARRGDLYRLTEPSYSSIPLWNVSRSKFTPCGINVTPLECVAFQLYTLRGQSCYAWNVLRVSSILDPWNTSRVLNSFPARLKECIATFCILSHHPPKSHPSTWVI